MSPSAWLSAIALVADVGIVVVLIPRIVAQRRESAATLAWVLFILMVPIAGAVLYHLLGTRRLSRKRRLRLAARQRLSRSAARAALAPYDIRAKESELEQASRLFYVERTSATRGNEVRLLHGAETYDAIEAAIAEASRYVPVEFYIFHPDRTGRRILDLLEQRARAGVTVRLLVDAVGASDLRQKHVAGLVAAGGTFAQFLPVNLFTRPFSVNFRNHRKIVSVDGHTAFTGGMNVGDESRGGSSWSADGRRLSGKKRDRFRDTHVRVRGPAALHLQEIFADDWHFSTGEDCAGSAYYPDPPIAGNVILQVVASGPDQTAEAIHRKLFTAITRAESRVWLTTPYFIPDRAILVALQTAAARGVDVRLLLPGTSDHRLVLYAGRSYYDELLSSGVRIFEYQAGFLHAKTMVVDDLWTTIGSANMDMRSFVLNWEATLVALDRDLARHVARQFEKDLLEAREITLPRRRSRSMRMKESASYLLSPLL